MPGSRRSNILIVAPTPPPYGGMALQAQLLARMLQQDGMSAEVLGYNQPFHPWFRLIERVPALRTLLRTIIFAGRVTRLATQSDVIHILACSWLYFFIVVTPALVIGRLFGKHVVLNYRGGDADAFLSRCGRLVRPVFQGAHTVTAPSEFLAQVIGRRLGMPVTIVPNIVDFSAFRFRERSRFQPRMLVTRHLMELYGVDMVLRAFRRVQNRYPHASLRIAGTGDQEHALRGLVSEWGLNHVDFLGYVGRADLPKLYDECDILLNGSRVDNFPASLLEASASGLVVVSTNAGGISFIYSSEKNALLVKVGDWDSMASAVIRVLENQSLGRELTSAARDLARQCEWSNVSTHLYASYGFSRTIRQERPVNAFSMGAKP